MRKLFNQLLMFSALSGTLFLASCSDDNEEITPTTPPDEETVVLEMEEGDASKNVSVDVDANTNTQTVRVKFTSTDNMNRLYVTENVSAQGDEPFKLEELVEGIDAKGDGSIDLDSQNKTAFEFEFDLPVPSVGTGTVVYTFWATSGRGDYRDVTKRLVVGPGTITLNYGGTNSAAEVKSYSATMFAAPLADGSSKTFISLLDGELFRINQGEEYAAFWDFGYYYGGTGKASLASTFNYPSDVIDVPNISGTAKEELNEAFFALSTSFDATAFDNV
ncbi:hypothetical protein E1176_02040, partial [Fulvivirga sp. RKSG066]|uniref:hypothetical protein n=1 Tax=Fulvivirga aurantia TaxID=2529383 RepID=UPI0012BD4C12